ncbi:unnamed protein product [Nippostrongylus brasiliensis]|uniref:Cocaine esterase n=1 Tax=Nippostrongylus brasiliensis TaxID=27835 RepID=A0A0N4Y948_NIPBR|nr:unnamed protein product [Nippostrongylus brasiliensis]
MRGCHLLLLALWALLISAQELVPTATVESLQGDLMIQEWMRELRRVKRAPTRNFQPIVVVLPGFDASRASPYYKDLLYPEPLRRRRAKRARYCPILGGAGARCLRLQTTQQSPEDVASDSGDDRFDSSGAVVLSTNGTGRCVVSADQASHFCGMDGEGKR